MTPIIKVENLSKKYTIRHEHPERYVALRDVIVNKAKKLFSFPSRLRPRVPATIDYEDFWALKGVEFDIQQGDRVGIIGRNGAGKSTLLKILSRITEPSTGRITLNGRVASLLEVGTGFHPELTGRENIYLNGAILGMSRLEIRKKFDEIVDFSGVEKFLDTPVKRYSSGMYVRLAFAVAAHLEPEILVVDEVLAVGDAEFQKKCLGKMEDVSNQEGRTVLFVSHNLSALSSLCIDSILLDKGKFILKSRTDKVISQYLKNSSFSINKYINDRNDFSKPQFQSIEIINDKIEFGENIEINISISTPYNTSIGIEIEIHDENGIPVSYSSNAPMQGSLTSIQCNELNFLKIVTNEINLASGEYSVYFFLIKPWAEEYHRTNQALKFEIINADPFKVGFDFKQSYRRGVTFQNLKIIQK